MTGPSRRFRLEPTGLFRPLKKDTFNQDKPQKMKQGKDTPGRNCLRGYVQISTGHAFSRSDPSRPHRPGISRKALPSLPT